MGPIGFTGPTGPTGPAGLNANVSPTYSYLVLFAQTGPSYVVSEVFSAGYTGGNPGAVAFLWQFVSNTVGATFYNPTTATSQRVRMPVAPYLGPEFCSFRCRLTDSLGAISYSETAIFEAESTGLH